MDQLAGRTGSFGAVGSPDILRPVPEGPEAHCDDADFLDDPSYPRTREEATATLLTCIVHLRMRVREAVVSAHALLDHKLRIIPRHVDLAVDCNYIPYQSDRAKCNALGGFGKALHGVQDFYAHSNWADVAKAPHNVKNPPGLGMREVAPMLDMSAPLDFDIPRNLSTGCFSLLENEQFPWMSPCKDRITHDILNKDTGHISPSSGKASWASTRRGKKNGNFKEAVRLAVLDTQRQWKNFMAELNAFYGTTRAELIICALTTDNPDHCYEQRTSFDDAINFEEGTKAEL